MSALMPCSVTAAGDEFDNEPMTGGNLLDERQEEEEEIKEIMEGLINGDIYGRFNHQITFASTVSDSLIDSMAFINALRALLNADDATKEAKAIAAIKAEINECIESGANGIFEDMQ